MFKTYLVTYVESSGGREDQIGVRVRDVEDFKKFTKDMNVVCYRDVTKYDQRTQDLNAQVRAGEPVSLVETLTAKAGTGSQWKGRGIGSLYDK